MTILLDSHAFVWFALDSRKLSHPAKAKNSTTRNVYVSAVVAWELATKVRSGKWAEAEPISARFFEVVRRYEFLHCPISLADGQLAGTLPGAHWNPFDRMLAAQAINGELTLVSAHRAFHDFGLDVLW